MSWEEIKSSKNEWLWDDELGTYFWLLAVQYSIWEKTQRKIPAAFHENAAWAEGK